ncbi:MAG: GMC family oxidoreductase [Planctomycetota bacterium]|nr:GMC family oxidoreductase [Planctomycetota bacterium]
MILEFDSVKEIESVDVCIIGSGAAGIATAKEFFDTNISVVVLEGGGGKHEEDSQDPYKCQIKGLPHRGTHEGRTRVLGGTTTLWAGQALPLFDIDFKKRDWVQFSGWPFSRDVLLPYYTRAEDVMQIPHVTYDDRSWPHNQRPIQSIDGSIERCFSQFARIPNFASKYRKLLAASKNVTVLLHANAIELSATPQANGVQSVTVKSFSGKTAILKAKLFVICCGGIDSARLLLASKAVEKNGIGNQHDVVGRFFQDHPTMIVPLKPKDPLEFDRRFGAIRKRSNLNLVKFFPNEHFQRENGILNVGAEVIHEDVDNTPLAAVQRFMKCVRNLELNGNSLSDLRHALKNPVAILGAGVRKTLGLRGRSVKDVRYSLLISSEQDPSPESRITISGDKDSLGMPRSIVNWKISSNVSRTIDLFMREITKQWRSLGIAEVDVDSVPILGRETGEFGGYSDFNHHIGTTRMGTDPKTSVVDASCRVHNYNNLYVASSSVFPTGSFSNPTLTVLALCCRIADELKASLKRC